MRNYDTFAVVRHPAGREFHFLIEDPDHPLGVVLCGQVLPTYADWPPATASDQPIELAELCPLCRFTLGLVLEDPDKSTTVPPGPPAAGPARRRAPAVSKRIRVPARVRAALQSTPNISAAVVHAARDLTSPAMDRLNREAARTGNSAALHLSVPPAVVDLCTQEGWLLTEWLRAGAMLAAERSAT